MNKFGVWTKTVDELPPEPKNKYDSCNYLCTVNGNQVVALNYIKTEIRNKVVVRWEHFGRPITWDVIAWMSYPESFTE
jgi:hypothetical protein